MSTTSNTLTLELTTSPDDDRPVFVAGNFNDWQAQDQRFLMKKIEPGLYRLTFPKTSILPHPLSYKYTRGDWQQTELNVDGEKSENRSLTIPTGKVKDHVLFWQHDGLAYRTDFLPQIKVLAKDFEIPQLIKTRRIAALLPHDYDETERHYPVLYLQDGQNLFDDYAPFGNWGVDKKLAMMAEKRQHNIIIIAIDHAEDERIEEFTPSYETRLGRGQGKKYARFLADTLKPYIDKNFRTMPDREHTGIGGSSMGALISIYAGIMYPEVYGKLMLFSPSLWVTPRIPFQAISFTEPMDTRIYLYAGGKESTNMIPNVKRLKQEIERNNEEVQIDFMLSIDPDGQHNEARWGDEFPKAVQWLFFHQEET